MKNVCSRIAILSIALLAAACFKNPGYNSGVAPATVGFLPSYLGPIGSYLNATGTCGDPGEALVVYSSALTSQKSVMINCSGGTWSGTFAVDSGDMVQTITGTIQGVKGNRRSTPVNFTVSWQPNTQGTGIVPIGAYPSGGGGTINMHVSGGEPVHPGTVTMGTGKVRLNFQGVLDP